MPSQYDLKLGRAGEAIRGGLLNFFEGGAPIRSGFAGLLRGDVEPLKQAVGYGQPFPQLTPEQMQQQSLDVAMDINNPMQNIGGLLGVIKNVEKLNKARQHFGITQTPEEAGYIIENPLTGWPELLDFSGRHYASGYQKDYSSSIPKYVAKTGQPDYLKRSRAVDHRELNDLVESSGGWERMAEFMDETGAIRNHPGVGISLIDTNKPSKKQIEEAVSFYKYRNLPIAIDIDAKTTGANIASKDFKKIDANEIYKWIEQYYK